MSSKVLSAATAAALDKELMGPLVGFSLDQLMELAGLSVAQAIYKSFSPAKHPKVLVLSGPGNNGGDGLVAARHLKLLGYTPSVFYFVNSKNPSKFRHLEQQLKSFQISLYASSQFTDTNHSRLIAKVSDLINESHFIVDGLFGFSFRPPLRAPYDEVVQLVNDSKKPVVAIDLPTGWDVDQGPLNPSNDLNPQVLVSLSAPKPASEFFKGEHHFLGGRFITKELAKRHDFDVPDYPGVDQIVELK